LLVGSSAPADEPKTVDLPPELNWIPGDAAAFLHVRLGELVNSPAWPAVRDALNRDDPGAIERVEHVLGVHLNQVDRLTVLLPVAAGNSPEDSIVVRVTTGAPYDRAAVLKLIDAERSPLPNLAQLPGSGGSVRLNDAKNLTLTYS